MQVLIAHSRYQQPGGEDEVFEAERRLLSRKGDRVVSYEEYNSRIMGMSRARLLRDTMWSESSRRRISSLLRQRAFDVAHFHNTFPLISPSAYRACRDAGVPVVQTLHNFRLLCPTATLFREGQVCEECLGRTPPWPGIVHGCYRESRTQTAVVAAMLTLHRWLGSWRENVDLYVAPSRFARRKLLEGGLPAERVVVKPHFVDPDPGVRQGEGSYVLFLGRLSPEKGLDTLRRAWRKVRGVPLRVAGHGPLRPLVAEAVGTTGTNGIEMVGAVERSRVPSLLQGARFLVVPSECYETFGLVIAEAFACGVPVVASRLGALEEMVEEDRTGLLFRPGDAGELAAKAEWLWAHPHEASRMGREARAEYEARYIAERNYGMLMEIYRNAISGRTSGNRRLSGPTEAGTWRCGGDGKEERPPRQPRISQCGSEW